MGTVAQGVWKHLENNFETMAARFGARYELARACVRDINKKRGVNIPLEKLTENPYDIVNDPTIDIVCELMGGTTDAFDITMSALKAGKVVVSANKAVICKRGSEIFQAARENGGAYFFEASVAGGIPVIKVLREGLVANQFPSIYGILNGTCNYILTRMERECATYDSVIADARRLGYVEADESLDIDGWDAAHKISILAYLAHGVWIDPADMLVTGIRGIRLEDMNWAKDFDSRIKLIASVRKNPETGALFAAVYPAILPLSDVVANVNEVYNAVSLTGDVVGRTVHIGRGAGQDATASAVIADIADAVRYMLGTPLRPSAVEGAVRSRLATLEEVCGEFYIRMEVPDRSGVLASIASDLASEGISIELLQQKKHEKSGSAWLLLTTHETTEAAIKRACDKLKNADYVMGEPFILRMWRGE